MSSEGRTYRKIMVDPDQFPSKDFATATRVVTVPLPDTPKSGYVVVRIDYAGVQASDIIQMSGGYGTLSTEKPVREPTGAVQAGDTGCEGVGVITETSDATEWPVGTTVAFFGYGIAFRELTVLPIQSLLKVPSSAPEWTALPVSALTAVGGLTVVGKIASFTKEKPATVLVTGAAGGTGHLAVQWAKKMHGARVAGTCGSDAKATMLSSIGCDVVVNYRTSKDVEGELKTAFPGGFDIVYDGVGGRIGDIGRRLLSPTGVFVGIGSVSQDYSGSTGPDAHNKQGETEPEKTALKEGQSETFFFMPAAPKIIGEAAWGGLIARTIEAIASGALKVVLDDASKAFTGLEGVYDAQARMRTGLNVGKIYSSLKSA